jgi:mannose-6-phosphate isomerase-like protein (cupin superfamily)
MRFFQKVAHQVDVLPLAHSLQKQPDLWNAQRFRTEFPGTPHVDVDDIWLRFSSEEATKNSADVGPVIGDGNVVFHPAWDYLPAARPLILDLMRRVGAYQLDRVLITRVKPGGRILPHADNEGGYVHERDRARYHVVLQGGPGNLFGCGDEVVAMHTGEIWWFDALTTHSVENKGPEDRIHLLVDLRCFL